MREVLVPIARYMGVVMNCLTRRKGNVEKTLQILLGSSSNPFSLFVCYEKCLITSSFFFFFFVFLLSDVSIVKN